MTIVNLPFDEDRRYTDIMLNDSYSNAEKREKLNSYASRVLAIVSAKNSILRNLNKLIRGETERLQLIIEVESLLRDKLEYPHVLNDAEAVSLNLRLIQEAEAGVLECKNERDTFQADFDQTNAEVAVGTEAVNNIMTFLSTLDD